MLDGSVILTRFYQPPDRPAVRRICCDTADKGEPVERFFKDREIFADILTRYYTDVEPESLWVAQADGQVVGYLTGCRDTRRYWRFMSWRIVPAALLRALGRGTFLQRQTWQTLWAGAKTLLAGGLQEGVPLKEYPSHLHINVKKEFRGRDLGRRLMNEFIGEMKKRGSQGVHLVTREDNLSARRFFEQFGFRELARRRVFRLDGEGRQTQESVIYGKRF